MNLQDFIDCSEWADGDSPISLEDLKNLIPLLQKKYGKHAQIAFDAGYNNVIVIIKPTKKVGYKNIVTTIPTKKR